MTLARAQTKDGAELPTHRFSPGDIVCVRSKSDQKASEGDDNSVRGIVYKVSNEKIQIALSAKPISLQTAQAGSVSTAKEQIASDNDAMNMDYNGKIVTIVQVGNDTTFKRMEVGLKKLSALHASQSMPDALKVLFGLEKPRDIQLSKFHPLDTRFTSAKMNESQLLAISGAMASTELFLIHGPPGTGKTTVLIEYILQAVRRQGLRLLVCAPSNVAVDNIVERLAPFTRGGSKSLSKAGQAPTLSESNASGTTFVGDLKIVRIGHPARVQNSALGFTVEEQYRQSNAYEIVQALQEDMDKTAKEISKASFGQKRVLRREWNDMRRDLKKVSVTGMKQVVTDANVVLATCTGADDRLLRDISQFDVVVVDEAAQALDPIIMIPLLRAKKIVLAGDHLQLPPTIKSTKAIAQSLCTTTFFERSIRKNPSIGRLLSVQYRMNDLIMKYSSSALYKGKLTSDDSVKEHDLDDLIADREHKASSSSAPTKTSAPSTESSPSSKDDFLKNPLILVDTAGCSFEESGGENESKSNEGESKVVLSLVTKLIAEVGLLPSDIGIISPYNAQVDLLRNLIRSDPLLSGTPSSSSAPSGKKTSSSASSSASFTLNPKYSIRDLEISSVDSFQGREKECIIYTLVRSNAHHNVGFLSSDQRTNVAITRAKRILIIVADTETCGSHKFLKKMFDFCEKNGQYWSGAEFAETYEALDHKTYSAASTKSKGKAKANETKKTEKAAPSAPAPSKVEDIVKAHLVASNTTTSTENNSSAPSSTFQTDSSTTASSAPAEAESLDLTQSNKFEHLESEVSDLQIAPVEEVKPIEEIKTLSPSAKPTASSTPAKAGSAKENSRLTTKPPMDYREMQKAKFEAQKAKATAPAPTASPYAAKPNFSDNSQESRFGIQSDYDPKRSQHAPKNAAPKAKKSSSNASSSSGPAPPVAVKKSLLELDDDAFLDSLIKESETCYMKGCKTSTKVISETCRFCKHIYCLKHMGSEAHGCAADAKREGIAAAKARSADLRIKAASPPVIDSTKTKDWQKRLAHEKLAKKVESQKEQRSSKKSAAK